MKFNDLTRVFPFMEHVIEAEVMQPSPFELDFYIFYAASLFYQGFSPLKFYFLKCSYLFLVPNILLLWPLDKRFPAAMFKS